MAKSSATFKNYEIIRENDNSITVCVNGKEVTSGNVLGTLRKIARESDFDYDDNWNTRNFGNKLITHLNSNNVNLDNASSSNGKLIAIVITAIVVVAILLALFVFK